MNLAVLKKTRRAPEAGDIFVMRPADGQYLFGRVIDTNARPWGGQGGGVLVYIYRARSSSKGPAPDLLRGQLLVPPMITNLLPWTRGYFELVEHRPLSRMDRLPQHCFRNSYGAHFDEAGNELAVPVEPVGRLGHQSYRKISNAVSEALGIPLSSRTADTGADGQPGRGDPVRTKRRTGRVARGVARDDRLAMVNLGVLMKSRRPPREGDIFVMRPPDGQYLYGRVIDTNAKPFTVDFRAVLIYIYRARSSVMTPVPELLRGQLLIPPKMTNRLPWSRGYFQHLENRPLSAMDRLPQHCFKDSLGGYRDQAGNAVPGPVEPVGLFALSSYRTIDDAISEALGIPLAPDVEE